MQLISMLELNQAKLKTEHENQELLAIYRACICMINERVKMK